MAGITWLHLSDWHQKLPEEYNRKRVFDRLLDDIRERASISSQLQQINFIVFTGDITNQAAPDEYGAVWEQFFQKVIEAAGVAHNPPDHQTIFLVPGNHDIDRSQIPNVKASINIHEPNLVNQLNNYLNQAPERSQILQPFSAYSSFVFDYFRTDERGLGRSAADSYAKVFSLGGKTIAIVGLNSAILSGRNIVAPANTPPRVHDYGYLALTERQISAVLDRQDVRGADIRIALMHHPFSWLIEEDRMTVQAQLSEQCHFILHGHEHMPRVEVTDSTLGKHAVIPAGSSYAGRYSLNPRYINAYNFVHLDFDSEQAFVYLRRWQEARTRWNQDTDSAPNGRMVFPIPDKNRNPAIVQVNAHKYQIPGTTTAINPYPLDMMLDPEDEAIDRRHRYTKITWEVTIDEDLSYRGKYTFAGTNTSEGISPDLIIPLTAIGAFEIQDLSPSARDLQENQSLHHSLLPHANRNKFLLQIHMNRHLRRGEKFNIQLEFCLPKVMYRENDFDAIGLRRFAQGVEEFEYRLETPYVLVGPRFYAIRETGLQDLGVTVSEGEAGVHRVSKIVRAELQDPTIKGHLFYYVRLGEP